MGSIDEQRVVGELLAPEIGDLVANRQNRQVRAALADLLDPEVADVLVAMEPGHRAVAFRLLPRDRQASVFILLPFDQQEALLAELNNEQLANLINELEPDDRAELFDEMPGQLVAELLAVMRPEERRRTQIVLGYPEHSIGRLMTPEYLTLRADWNVGRSMEHIRRRGREAESLDTLYVVDDGGRLIDEVVLRDLILSDPETVVESLMDRNIVALRATEDREEAVHVMERYDVHILPVVDRDNVLVGIVTFDDVADVATEEVTEDIQKIGGMEALDAPYMSASVFHLVWKRGIWLAVLFLGGLLTIVAMARFEDQINQVVVLALFVPLIIASGGNSGSQAASLMIRAIAIGEVAVRDWRRVVVRELISGMMMGAVLGGMGLAVVLTADGLGWIDAAERAGRVALTVGGALISVVLYGTIVGSMLPFVLKALGVDPATGSTPLVATITDVSGLIIYFTLAVLILGL